MILPRMHGPGAEYPDGRGAKTRHQDKKGPQTARAHISPAAVPELLAAHVEAAEGAVYSPPAGERARFCPSSLKPTATLQEI